MAVQMVTSAILSDLAEMAELPVRRIMSSTCVLHGPQPLSAAAVVKLCGTQAKLSLMQMLSRLDTQRCSWMTQ
jgi:hypothetical protein